MGFRPGLVMVADCSLHPAPGCSGRAPRPSPRSGKDQGNPGRGSADGRCGRGGPEPQSREQLVVPMGVWEVSQRERPHPNKRLKLSAPRAPTGGATQATRPAIRKSLICSAAVVRAAA